MDKFPVSQHTPKYDYRDKITEKGTDSNYLAGSWLLSHTVLTSFSSLIDNRLNFSKELRKQTSENSHSVQNKYFISVILHVFDFPVILVWFSGLESVISLAYCGNHMASPYFPFPVWQEAPPCHRHLSRHLVFCVYTLASWPGSPFQPFFPVVSAVPNLRKKFSPNTLLECCTYPHRRPCLFPAIHGSEFRLSNWSQDPSFLILYYFPSFPKYHILQSEIHALSHKEACCYLAACTVQPIKFCPSFAWVLFIL